MLMSGPSDEVSGSLLRNTKRVSVLVMTYNHERYISQALDSVLVQQTSFDWEVLVSEDCSTDQTRQIVKEYADRHPGLIRLILSEKNLHSNEVVARGILAAEGQYLALLDGDDYWLTSDKLQNQVDFMDRHPESTVCFHQSVVHDERTQRPDWYWTPPHQKEISNLQDICMDNFIATSSTMFRRRAIQRPPEWYIAFFPITDWPLHILYAEQGTIGYLPKTMSVYRYHEGGAYSGWTQSRKEEEAYRLYQRLDDVFGRRYHRFFQAGVFEYFLDCAEEHERLGEREQALVCLRRGLTGRPMHFVPGLQKLVRAWLRFIMPKSTNPSLSQ
ncbi:MAG TPA: glycosyltransferase [Candidatus Sulfotelmatobacter sp.]|nr:glycosyltransferase [Candidatus Sulfotelmatobacter sp.]